MGHVSYKHNNNHELTNKQLIREMNSVREIVETELKGVTNTLNARLDSVNRAVHLMGETGNKSHELIVSKVEKLQEVTAVKFMSVEKQFEERDVRQLQSANNSTMAINASLQAAKEAVAEQNKSNAQSISKSEAAFTKQIDQIGTLIQNTIEAMNGKLDDVKQRITAIENKTQGSAFQSHRASNTLNQIMTGLVAVVVVLGAIVSIVIFVATHATR